MAESFPAPFPPDPDLSGRQLGDYYLLRRLGRGGMADVYLAEQRSLRRQVAFKVLKGGLANDDSYVRRFHNEAQAAAKLVHANIVQIYEVGCIEGIHFIAQEYVAGQNLKQFLGRRGPLEAAMAYSVLRQVVSALHKAAEQGIVHRDIKPENILLSTNGEVKVADFGLARIGLPGQAVDLTQVGVTMGTPLYMSPEQVEGGTVDPRSDIYSLGVTAYQMIAGRPPFEGDTPLSVAVQHLKTEPAALQKLRPDMPAGLCHIVHKMLAKQPADRYQRPSELLGELRQLQIEEAGAEWLAHIDEWSTPELIALADTRLEATQRLATVMKTQAAILPRRRPLALVAGATTWVAVSLLTGGLAAWLNRPGPLLEVDEAGIPPVEKQPTVEEQYWHAFTLNTEVAWQSVERFFPPNTPVNELYALRARRRLAEYYRENDQPEAAREQYRQLTALEPEDPFFGAVGLVGEANLQAQAGDRVGARQHLARLAQVWQKLTAEQQRLVTPQLDAALQEEFQSLRSELQSP